MNGGWLFFPVSISSFGCLIIPCLCLEHALLFGWISCMRIHALHYNEFIEYLPSGSRTGGTA